MNQELHELPNIEELSRRAAETIIAAGREAVQKRGRFTLVLTGGATVQGLYRHLAGIAAGPELKELWPRTAFFLGDERWVPEDHPDSNGALARRLLLAPSGIAASHIFLIPTGLASPERAATAYEQTLRRFFAGELSGTSPVPEFDLILLGLGVDGHVASLFPGTAALKEKVRWVTTSFPPELTPAVTRITMSLPVLNRARTVVILAAGPEKQAIVRLVLAAPQEAGALYPAGLLRTAGRQVWLLAAS